jgi:outer membrane protein
MLQLVKRLSNLSLAALLILSLSSQAQDARKITLQEAIDLGLKQSYQLKVLQAKADVAQAKYDQYRFATIPAVAINSSYTRISDNITPFSIYIPGKGNEILNPQILDNYLNRGSISQIVFAGMRGFYLTQSAHYLQRAAELDINNSKSEVRNNLINAFYNFYKANESKKLIEENLKVLEKRLYDTKNFQSVGMALPNDVLKVELAISQQQQMKAELESAIQISNYNLDVMLGLPTETVLVPDEASMFGSHSNNGSQAFQSAALNNRFDLKAMDWRTRASYKMVRSSRGGYAPVISAGANYYYNKPNQRVFPPEAKFKNTWDLGVSLSWNLSTLFTNRYNVREAKANFAANTASQSMMTDAIKMEVNNNYNNYALSLQKIELSEKAVTQAVENQRVMKNQYENNVKILSDLLDADLLLLQAKLNLTNAKIDAETAYQRLLKASALDN